LVDRVVAADAMMSTGTANSFEGIATVVVLMSFEERLRFGLPERIVAAFGFA
jgi:hypothetical protein